MENNIKINTDILEYIKDIKKEDIDVIQWEEYIIGDLFNIKKNPKWLNKSDMKEGHIPVISNTEKNNGVSNYVDIDYGIHKNKITVSNNGSVGETFYHPYNFYAQSGISILDIKDENIKLNKNIAMFLIPIIKHIRIKYNYGKKLESSLLSKETIKLPSKYNEESSEIEPDWEYMESYITNLEKDLNIEKINNVIDKVRNIEKKPINISDWIEFSIDSLFELKRGQRLRSVDRKEGNIRYFSATSDNNGVSCFISNPLFIEENALIFNTFGNVFYSDKIFTGSDEITILKHEKLNKRIGLFLSTTMSNQLEYKFGFGKKAFYNEVRKEKIKLPSKYNEETSEIEPDWEYMESYIKDLEKELKMF